MMHRWYYVVLLVVAHSARAFVVQFRPENFVRDWPNSQNLPLFNYVAKPDDSFAYFDTGRVLNSDRLHGQWIAYELNFTSQTWLSEKEVSRAVWTHKLVVIVPDQLRVIDQAFMYVTGSTNVDEMPLDATKTDIAVTAKMAADTGSIGITLFQVPNEPMVFYDDPTGKLREEDGIVAFTWWKFFKDPSKPFVLNQNPMVKSAVRAMDVAQHFCKAKEFAELKQFVVAGASKRGWTTWLTGAVDSRVKAIIPLVMDLLNMQEGLLSHYKSLGGWSFAFHDYYDMNLTMDIGTPRIPLLGTIMDVLTYKKYLNIPKLVVDCTGDEFFLLDDDHHWWNQLPGNTWRLLVGNAEHSMETGILEILSSTVGFYEAILKDFELPKLSWSIHPGSGAILASSNAKPSQVILRSATTDPSLTLGKRDFRLFRGITPERPCHTLQVDGVCLNPFLWTGEDLELAEISADGRYSYIASKPMPIQHAFTGFFVEMHFPGASPNTELIFTTQASIIPDIYPFDPPVPGTKGNLL